MADQPPPHLVTFLADRDEPCPACYYNLRGLLTNHCPECNRELVLQIRLAEPRIGAWIAALAASAAMFGFNGLLFVYFAYHLLVERNGPGRVEQATFALGISTLIAAIGLTFLIVRRRAFGNLPMGGRVALAIGGWVVTAFSAVVFFSFVS